MTLEEMEQTIQFILQQQAEFAVSRQQTQEEIRELGRMNGELQGAMISLTGILGRLIESHQELAKAQAHTEERLSAFITFVERYISEGGRN